MVLNEGLLYALSTAMTELGYENARLRSYMTQKEKTSLLNERLHGAKCCVGQGTAQPLRCVARLIAMLLVEERVEGSMEGLDLRL